MFSVGVTDAVAADVTEELQSPKSGWLCVYKIWFSFASTRETHKAAKAENSPSHSTVRRERPTLPGSVAAVPINYVARGVVICRSTFTVRRVTSEPRGRTRGCYDPRAIARLAHAGATKVGAGAAHTIHVTAVAPFPGASTVAMVEAAGAVGAVNVVAVACTFVARPGRAIGPSLRRQCEDIQSLGQ